MKFTLALALSLAASIPCFAQAAKQVATPTKPDNPTVLKNIPFNWNPSDGHVCRWMHNYYAYSVLLYPGKTYFIMTSDSRAKGGAEADPYLYLITGRASSAKHESHEQKVIGPNAWGDNDSGVGKNGREALIIITPTRREWYTIRLRSNVLNTPGFCTLTIGLSKTPLVNTPPIDPNHCE